MANNALAFRQHYVEYLVSPRGLIAIVVALMILLYLITGTRNRAQEKSDKVIPGCIRLGLRTKSLFDESHSSISNSQPDGSISQEPLDEPHIKALFVYPVKSCRGVELSASEVTATGLKYDRMISFAQLVSKKPDISTVAGDITQPITDVIHSWRFITQREFPRLAMLSTELWMPDPRIDINQDGKVPGKSHTITREKLTSSNENWTRHGGCLVVRFPYENDSTFFGTQTEMISLKIPLAPNAKRAKDKGYTYENMAIWNDNPESINITNEIDPEALAKLKYFLGVTNPLGLFRVDNESLRDISRSLPKDRPNDNFQVGFADAFPMHLLSVASVQRINDQLPKSSKVKDKLDARRFRANVYVDGVSAFEEDRWMRMSVGQAARSRKLVAPAEYHIACRTARCTLPNVHPDTGLKDRNEPHSTLKRTRQVDEGAKPHPCLGLSMMPLFARGVIRVGDTIEVTETGEHYYEKMFK